MISLSSSVTPCPDGARHSVQKVPGATKPNRIPSKKGCCVASLPNTRKSHSCVYLKKVISVNPVTLTSKQIWFPQLAVSLSIIKASGRGAVVVSWGLVVVSTGIVVSSQVIATAPFCKTGFNKFPWISTTSTGIGVLEKSMLASPTTSFPKSKQSWNKTAPSSKFLPCKLESSYPTLSTPGVVVLNWLASISGKPNDCTVLIPNKLVSQFKEYWKEEISVNPATRTSKQVCSPHIADTWLREKDKVSEIVILSASPESPQSTVIVPLAKLGSSNCPWAFTTSIAKGVLVKSTLVVVLLPPNSSKQISNKTALFAKLTPLTLESSHPTLAIPGVFKLKLASFKSVNPKFWTLTFPRIASSQLIEYWKERMSEKSWTLTSKQVCSPQAIVDWEREKEGWAKRALQPLKKQSVSKVLRILII